MALPTTVPPATMRFARILATCREIINHHQKREKGEWSARTNCSLEGNEISEEGTVTSAYVLWRCVSHPPPFCNGGGGRRRGNRRGCARPRSSAPSQNADARRRVRSRSRGGRRRGNPTGIYRSGRGEARPEARRYEFLEEDANLFSHLGLDSRDRSMDGFLPSFPPSLCRQMQLMALADG
jgi:hypothetical protein